MVNVQSVESGYSLANAVLIAASHARRGDIIQVEQQAQGPAGNGAYVPSEWDPAVYDAIRNAVSAGIIVVEAAGNGGQNLNNATLYGSSFPQGKPGSGAIIAGAGEECNSLRPTGALSFSTYGKRVNLQGWGDCVTTTGYGGLYDGGPKALYTDSFNGTSSATPVVTGAAASLCLPMSS